MLKVLYFSSEVQKKFGVYNVISILRNKLKKKFFIKISNKVSDIYKFNPNLIHIHGCWRPGLLVVFFLAKLSNIKIVLSPHGMLDPISFSQKKIIKVIIWFLYQKYIFEFSNLIIVNSLNEKKNLKRKIINNKIIVVPHGIHTNTTKITTLKKKGQLNFVFFSRIHPIKNLDRLIDIWISNNFFKNYNLKIYGDIENKIYFKKILTKIRKFKKINYLGSLYSDKIRKLSKNDIFIFPSKTENFGLVVLEAMLAGLYIVFNKNLPWKHLVKNGFGSSFDLENEKSLSNQIEKLSKTKNKIRNKEFQIRLKTYLYKNYRWDQVSEKYFKNYSKIISN